MSIDTRAGVADGARPKRVPRLLQVVQTFVQIDIRSPGISQERQRNAEIRPLCVGHVELHSSGFRLLSKRLEIFDLESAVITPSSFGRSGLWVRISLHKGNTR